MSFMSTQTHSMTGGSELELVYVCVVFCIMVGLHQERANLQKYLLGFELADHSLGLVVEGGDDLVGVLFRVVKNQAADREIDDFMTVPRSRPG
jgi:hypothetical protein